MEIKKRQLLCQYSVGAVLFDVKVLLMETEWKSSGFNDCHAYLTLQDPQIKLVLITGDSADAQRVASVRGACSAAMKY